MTGLKTLFPHELKKKKKHYFLIDNCNILEVNMSYVLENESVMQYDDVELGPGRAGVQGEIVQTPDARGVSGSPALCSTRIPASHQPFDSDMCSPDLSNLITQLAHQIGQSITAQLQKGNEIKESGVTQAQSTQVEQSPADSRTLNLTGVKLVIQSDVKEPPSFHGDGSDKVSIHEWEEQMNTYLRKRGTPLEEQAQEILSRLSGKARDVIKIILRSNSFLKPSENPNVIIDILKQHFSELTYSSMPLADFYNTLPVVGECAMDYWIRLHKAVDVAEECLKRQGRKLEDSGREVIMMFVKHCPDSALAAILKFKTADKWTASEIQERLDVSQTECRAQQQQARQGRSTIGKCVTVHSQTSVLTKPELPCNLVSTLEQTEVTSGATVSTENSTMQSLIGLLDHVLKQNNQTTANVSNPFNQRQPFRKPCGICGATEHSTTMHCRREGLCLACFQPGHWKKDCRNRRSRIADPSIQVFQERQSLNN